LISFIASFALALLSARIDIYIFSILQLMT